MSYAGQPDRLIAAACVTILFQAAHRLRRQVMTSACLHTEGIHQRPPLGTVWTNRATMQAMDDNMCHFMRDCFIEHFSRMRSEQLRIQTDMAIASTPGKHSLPRRPPAQIEPHLGNRQAARPKPRDRARSRDPSGYMSMHPRLQVTFIQINVLTVHPGIITIPAPSSGATRIGFFRLNDKVTPMPKPRPATCMLYQ